MTDLLSPPSEPALRALARPGTLVVLDFDGTLSPIVGRHQDARVTRRSRQALQRLARSYPVAILSGRAAADVRTRLDGVEVQWVVGSHGVEWPGEDRQHRAWRRLVGAWKATLKERLGDLAGLEVEAKPLSIAIHYRNCPAPKEAERLALAAAEALQGAALVPGKMVLNVLPRGAGDKGEALRRLVSESGAQRVLFVGDDATDEAAFRTRLDVPAVMVRVGHHASSRARYWLKRRSAVDTLLARLVKLRGHGSGRTTATSDGEAPEDAGDALGPVLAFMKQLWALEQGLNRRSLAMLSRHGITGPQRLLVLVVGRLGPVGQAELARVLHLHPSSVLRLVARLERRGFVRRVAHPTDFRRLLVELGPNGRRVERLKTGTVESAIRAALAKAERRDVAATSRLLGDLARHLLRGS